MVNNAFLTPVIQLVNFEQQRLTKIRHCPVDIKSDGMRRSNAARIIQVDKHDNANYLRILNIPFNSEIHSQMLQQENKDGWEKIGVHSCEKLSHNLMNFYRVNWAAEVVGGANKEG